MKSLEQILSPNIPSIESQNGEIQDLIMISYHASVYFQLLSENSKTDIEKIKRADESKKFKLIYEVLLSGTFKNIDSADQVLHNLDGFHKLVDRYKDEGNQYGEFFKNGIGRLFQDGQIISEEKDQKEIGEIQEKLLIDEIIEGSKITIHSAFASEFLFGSTGFQSIGPRDNENYIFGDSNSDTMMQEASLPEFIRLETVKQDFHDYQVKETGGFFGFGKTKTAKKSKVGTRTKLFSEVDENSDKAEPAYEITYNFQVPLGVELPKYLTDSSRAGQILAMNIVLPESIFLKIKEQLDAGKGNLFMRKLLKEQIEIMFQEVGLGDKFEQIWESGIVLEGRTINRLSPDFEKYDRITDGKFVLDDRTTPTSS